VAETFIVNADADPFVGAVLSAVAQDLEGTHGTGVTVRRTPDPGTKGPIVDAILTGIASEAVWEVLKLAARRFRNRDDYRPEAVIEFDGREVTVKELADDESPSGSS
jgi:hypothetical protein